MTFKQAKCAAGFTLQQLAFEVGCSMNTVARWCAGRSVSGEFVQAVKQAFAKRGVEWGPEVCPCCGRAL